MTSFCDNIADIFVQKSIIGQDEKEVYRYGLEILLSTVFGAVLVLVVGIVLQRILEAILFYLIMVSTRMYTGGYHADTHLKCKILFVSLCCCVLGVSYLLCLFRVSGLTVIPFLVAEVGVLMVYAPIENEKKRIAKENVNKLKIISIVMFFFWVFLSFLVSKLHMVYFWTVQCSISSIVLLMLYEKIKKEEIQI